MSIQERLVEKYVTAQMYMGWWGGFGADFHPPPSIPAWAFWWSTLAVAS
ncbi:MAG: hypothetical protein R3E39_15560 [Anaerolineae bacterium]